MFPGDRKTERQTDGWTDGRTDITEVIVAFRNFAKAPKIYAFQLVRCERFGPQASAFW
jgi:hypothetical protein